MTLAKVLLIEDDVLLRSALAQVMSTMGFEIVGQVDNAEEALLSQKLYSPEVAIIDLDLGAGPNGLDIAEALRRNNPSLGILILTSFTDPRLADTRNLQMPKGSMYLQKNVISDLNTLISATLQVKIRPLSDLKLKTRNTCVLTDTQIEILKSVAEGQTTKSIAEHRQVTEKSVEAMLARIHNTLGLTRSERLNPRIQLTRAFLTLSGKNPPNA